MRALGLTCALVTYAAMPVFAQGLTDCTSGRAINQIGPSVGDSAFFQVDMLGNVLLRPSQSIDENDVVVVYVNTTRQFLPFLRVRRTSPLRPVGLGSIVGARGPVTDAQVRELAEASTNPECLLRVVLADFAPGPGVVSIASARADQATSTREVEVGTFDFRVNPLYIGVFSIGPIRSTLRNPSFSMVFNGTDSVVSASNIGRRTVYAVLYTPFVWRSRDLEKSERNVLRHFNPFFGVTLSEVGSNALVGVSLDLPAGILFHYGAHIGRVTRIDPASGLQVGATASGLSAVPTVQAWNYKPFVGVSLDMRAALRFFQVVSGAALPNR